MAGAVEHDEGSEAGGAAASVPLELVDAWWRAANYLSVGQIYLMRNPLLDAAARARRHQAAPARPLGHLPRAQPRLRAPQPRDRRARHADALRVRPGARRPGDGREHVARRHVLGALPRDHRRPRGHGAAVPPVLVPRRHPVARGARDAGLDQRGRRARLLAHARLRRGARQPRARRRVRDRRRRGRDRPARRELARRTRSSTR